jgi:pimeloyl-ACP methyl ester carboxylesterase
MPPRIRFVRGGRGHRLATATCGSGPPLVLPAWWVSHVEHDLAAPRFRAFFAALASRWTVVRYDRAGVGLSDRSRERFELEDEVADLEAVLDGLELGRASLLAISCGAPPAVTLAARRPERVERLVIFGGYLHGAGIGRPEVQRALVALVRASWGLGARALCDIFLPDATPDEAQRFGEDQRHAATAEMSARLLELTYAMDARDAASGVRAPTLVLHRRDDRAIAFEHGRQTAAAIPGAELVALDGNDHLPWAGDAAAVLAALAAAPVPVVDDDGGPMLRRDGEVWTVRRDGRTVHARHSRGLADLALLVAQPGRRFAAAELVAAAHGEPPVAATAAPVLDETARAQFRARLAALDEALATAGAGERPERAARLEAEREAILGELRAATGLGGRRRALGDEAERARKAVTARIRESIARLHKLDGGLGAHLEAAVETGASCVYAPATPLRWRT